MQKYTEEKLQAISDDLGEKMNCVQNFEPISEIHAYCDTLVADVALTFDSAFQHLQRLQDSMLAEIAEYRSNLIEAQRQRAASLKEEQRLSFTEKLAELAALKDAIPRMNEQTKSSVALSLKTQLRAIREQEAELRKETMGGRFMRFKPNRFFDIVLDHVGTLEYLEDIPPACGRVEIRDECFNFDKDSKTILQVSFMSGDRLVVSSYHDGVLIYRASDLSLLERLPDLGMTFTVLPGERLVSGTSHGELRIYDLSTPPCDDTKREYLVLDSNRHRKRSKISSSVLLPNGNLATSDFQGRIEIWDLSLAGTNRALLLCLNEDFGCKLGALSNGFLVMCTIREDEISVLKLWDLKSTQPLRVVVTPLVFVMNLLVLPNDRVALNDGLGNIVIYDLVDMQLVWKINIEADNCGMGALGLMPNGCLIAGDVNKRFNIWDLTTGKLVQKIDTGIRLKVTSIHISPDGKRMAVSSISELKISKLEIVHNDW